MKIYDIVAPKDNWEKHYALMEYLYTQLKQIGQKRIEVRNG